MSAATPAASPTLSSKIGTAATTATVVLGLPTAPIPPSMATTLTPSPANTTTTTLTPSPASTATPTLTPSPASTATPTLTPSPASTATPTLTPSPASTATTTLTPSLASTATFTPTPFATATAALTSLPVPTTLRVTAIEPAVFSNDASTRVTLIGTGFVADTPYAVSVAGSALRDVRFESLTRLTGTLAPGLCPGVYSATVADALDHTSGGSIQARGTLSATSLTHDIAGPAIAMIGRVQRVRMTLPSVQIRDTTCGTGDLHLHVSVGEFAQVGGRSSWLSPLSIQAGHSDSGSQPVTRVDGSDGVVLVIPRPNGRAPAEVALSAEIEIPAYPAAGDYRAAVTVDLLENVP